MNLRNLRAVEATAGAGLPIFNGVATPQQAAALGVLASASRRAKKLYINGETTPSGPYASSPFSKATRTALPWTRTPRHL